MGQNVTSEGIVLSIKPLGENNASVCIYTQLQGIIYATMYGGPKSRLKSLVSPWNSGIFYLAENSSNKNLKISDFDVKKYHLSFREDLLKSYSACLAAEILIKTKCSGYPEQCWILFNGFLDGLELCEEKSQIKLGLIRFLWRYIELLGLQPNATECAICLKPTRKNNQNSISYQAEGAFYSVTENIFTCASCSSGASEFYLSADCMNYLSAVTTLSPKESRMIFLSQEDMEKLKSFLFFLIENAVGQKLYTIQSALGIL